MYVVAIISSCTITACIILHNHNCSLFIVEHTDDSKLINEKYQIKDICLLPWTKGTLLKYNIMSTHLPTIIMFVHMWNICNLQTYIKVRPVRIVCRGSSWSENIMTILGLYCDFSNSLGPFKCKYRHYVQDLMCSH